LIYRKVELSREASLHSSLELIAKGTLLPNEIDLLSAMNLSWFCCTTLFMVVVGHATSSVSSGALEDEDGVETSERLLQEECDLGLKQSLGVQKVVGLDGILVDDRGRRYSLSRLEPYTELFSPDSYEVSKGGKYVTHRSSGDRFDVSVYRATFNDGTVLQVTLSRDGDSAEEQFTDDGGSERTVHYAELRRPGGYPDMFFVPSPSAAGEKAQRMIAFTIEDFDASAFQQLQPLGDARPIPGSRLHRRASAIVTHPDKAHPRELLLFVYTRGDGTSSDCSYFKTVEVAVVFDAEFCQFYGSVEAARARVQAIVASASIYYENDMCVKLQLDRIYPADSACQGPSKVFGSSNFTRLPVCADKKPHLLFDFSKWINPKRDALGIKASSLVHLFTGYQASDALGCGYLGSYCWREWSYGVEFMTFRRGHIVSQGIVMAHELGVSAGYAVAGMRCCHDPYSLYSTNSWSVQLESSTISMLRTTEAFSST
jgi:hypothetical protein